MDCSGANAGLICGVTAANVCGPCTSDSSCTSDTFYGPNTICNTARDRTRASASRAPARTTTRPAPPTRATSAAAEAARPATAASTPTAARFGSAACINHTCSACNAVTGNTVLRRPGERQRHDRARAATCRARRRRRAARSRPSRAPSPSWARRRPPAPRSSSSAAGTTPRGLAAGDSLPITIPTNTHADDDRAARSPITLATTGQGNGRRLPAEQQRLGDLRRSVRAAGARRQQLRRRHRDPGHSPGNGAFTSSVSNVTIRNTNGDGIRVNAGTLTIGAGVVQAFSNQDGLRVPGGTANVTNASGAQTSFQSNVSTASRPAATGR